MEAADHPEWAVVDGKRVPYGLQWLAHRPKESNPQLDRILELERRVAELEQRLREIAYAHRGEVIPGSGVPVEPRDFNEGDKLT